MKSGLAANLMDELDLPGSLQAQGFGDDIAVDTPWTGDIYDRSWFVSPQYAPYREPGQIKVPFGSSRTNTTSASHGISGKSTSPPSGAESVSSRCLSGLTGARRFGSTTGKSARGTACRRLTCLSLALRFRPVVTASRSGWTTGSWWTWGKTPTASPTIPKPIGTGSSGKSSLRRRTRCGSKMRKSTPM